MLKSISLALAVLTLSLLFAPAAFAHARFDHSTPSPGQVLSAPPTAIDIFTAQDMRKITGANTISVQGPDGSQVDNGNTVVDDSNRRHYSVGLKANLPPGRYVVSFKTLSDEDGEADHGQFAFYLGVQPTDAQKAQDASLQITSQSDEPASSSHTGLIIGIGVAVVIVIAIGGGWILMRRRSAPGG